MFFRREDKEREKENARAHVWGVGGNRVVKGMTHVSGLSNQGGAGAVCVRFGARGGWLELGQGAIWRRGIIAGQPAG